MTATLTATSANATPLAPSDIGRTAHQARVDGLDSLVMGVGLALEEWALRHAERKAAAYARSGLSALSDHERAALFREATRLRDKAYADGAGWHVTG